jgi:hypothetical protein
MIYSRFIQEESFWLLENLCCSSEIPEVPTIIIPIQLVLEALEGSGKA